MAADSQTTGDKPPAPQRDWWRWLQILVVPVTTIIIGQYASSWQEKESARRTYADMMSRREEAESALRKDMFQTTISPFLQHKSDDIEASVLRLELLVTNFHDALDLSPLFKDVYRTLVTKKTEASAKLLARLATSAQEVVRREVDAIREASIIRTGTVDLDTLKQGPVNLFGDEMLKLPGGGSPSRTMRVDVLSYNKEANEFLVRLAVLGGGNPPVVELQTKPFHLGPFDFPLIDNTRLSGGDRVALSFDGSAEDVAQIMLIYFPGSRASMKDKQYYEDMAAELLRIQERSREKAQTTR
jgi:hypothetical protein